MTLPLLIYALAEAELYGTERMALATLDGLRHAFRPMLLALGGDVHDAAAQLGIESREFRDLRTFPFVLARLLWGERNPFVVTTTVRMAMLARAARLPMGRARLVHVLHGGGEEHEVYRSVKRLNGGGMKVVAVSPHVALRLAEHGVDRNRIAVVENFLTGQRIAELASRPRHHTGALGRVLLISRLDRAKRLDVVFDALDATPELRSIEFRFLGDGPLAGEFRARARDYPNVEFLGFVKDLSAQLGAADLMLHCNPTDYCPLGILEAMAASVPVLTADQGGAGGMVEPGVTGFHFRSNDPQDLARQLLALAGTPERLLEVGQAGRAALDSRFSMDRGIEQYRQIFASRPSRGAELIDAADSP